MDLNVPYAEKDAAKALGAKWDPTRKTWYVPPGVDINRFARWAPGIEQRNRAADGRGKSASRRRAEPRMAWKKAKLLAVEQLATIGRHPSGMGWTPARIGRALGLSIHHHSNRSRIRRHAWRQAIVGWAQSQQAVDADGNSFGDHPASFEGLLGRDAFNLPNPYDQYLHSLIASADADIDEVAPASDIVAVDRTVQGSGAVAPQGSDRLGSDNERAGKVSHIAGRTMTGKHYVPADCPDCESRLPWESQCAACAAAFESRAAIARAEAGVMRSNRESASESSRDHDCLCNTNSSKEFMARQLDLSLLDQSNEGIALQGPQTRSEVSWIA